MENLYIHNVRDVYFIKVFFWIIVGFLSTVISCLFLFDINDSVTFNTGEIISEVPQLDVKAPFEVIPIDVRVHEGQRVSAGDTLMILSNEDVRRSFDNAESSVTYMQRLDSSIEELTRSCYHKIVNLEREKQIGAVAYQTQHEKLTVDIKAAAQRTALSREKLNTVALTKLKMDSSLYKQSVISKLDITNSFDNYTNYKNTLLEQEITENQARAALKTLENDYLRMQNALDLKVIELQEQIKQLTQQKTMSGRDLHTAQGNYKYLTKEVRKQYVVSEIDGEVFNLYNLKFNQNFVNKGDILLSVVPNRDKFYAKVIIPQRQVRYIKPGQDVHLKVDAYYYYEKGILKGTVNYIPERKPKEDFFVIIDLEEQPKFNLKAGYSLRGEIIVERLKIYKFIIKKLLRTVDGLNEPSVPVVQPVQNVVK